MAALAPTLPVPRLARKRDDELVARVRGGDDGAFAEIHDRYRAPLERYARRLLGDRTARPQDVVQDLFLRAHAALREGDREMHLRAWLFTMVRTRCLDELRRGGAAGSAPAVSIDDAVFELPAGAHSDPHEVVTRRHDLRSM